MLIEAMKDSLLSIGLILKFREHIITVYDDLNEALEEIEANDNYPRGYEMVITDHLLSSSSKKRIERKLDNLIYKPHLFFLTDFYNKTFVEEVTENGVSYMEKPIEPKELLEHVNETINN